MQLKSGVKRELSKIALKNLSEEKSRTMILDIVESIGGVPIRLTDERWEHILENHSYMSSYYDAVLDSVEKPEFILRGQKGSKVGVINVGRKKWLLVTYREINKSDGFIITAYIEDKFNKNLIIWKRYS